MDRRILFIPDAIFFPCARDARWGVQQSFARRIVASPFDKRTDRGLDVVGNQAFSASIQFFGSDEAIHDAFVLLWRTLVHARLIRLPCLNNPPLANGSNISSGCSGSSTCEPASFSSTSPTSGGT